MALEQQDICMQTVSLHTIFQNSQSNALQTSQKLPIDSTGEILAHFKCTNSIIKALKYNPVNNPHQNPAILLYTQKTLNHTKGHVINYVHSSIICNNQNLEIT